MHRRPPRTGCAAASESLGRSSTSPMVPREAGPSRSHPSVSVHVRSGVYPDGRGRPEETALTVTSAAVLFVLVMDPLGNVPFFAAALATVPPARRGRVAARELLIAYAVMAGFLFAGRPALALLQISEPALTI